jgi:NAD(P)-dependent dehydrogenase (short-subunit alcohol dehydrogenase family)
MGNRKTILVTGSTSGIGLAAAQELSRLGMTVLVHGRSRERVHEAAARIRQATGGSVEEWVADFSSLMEVRGFAERLLDSHPRLDALLNNAGVFMRRRSVTADGFETTFAVNYLAPFLLTNLLLPRLRASAPARIVNMASKVHLDGRARWDDLQSERGYTGYDAYALSKLADVLFTFELAERLAGTGVTANCLHPGTVDTKLLNAGFAGHRGMSPAQGAETAVYLLSSPDVGHVTGRYFEDGHPALAAAAAGDSAVRRRLWRVSAKLVGLPNGAPVTR